MKPMQAMIMVCVPLLSCFCFVPANGSGTATAHAQKTKPTQERTASMQTTVQVTSYLLLDGNCKEALEFYHSVLAEN